MTKKIYLVSQGSYSDYRIVAAFSTQELADEYCRPLQSGYDPPGVEEYELDVPYKQAPADHLAYSGVIVIETGEVRSVRANSYMDECRLTVCDDIDSKNFRRTGHKALHADFYATDDEHAAKILTEKRQEHLRSVL